MLIHHNPVISTEATRFCDAQWRDLLLPLPLPVLPKASTTACIIPVNSHHTVSVRTKGLMSKTTKIILIICGILAVCTIPVLLILMTLAVPAMQKVTIRAHETSVMQSLRVLNSAEETYSASYPQQGFACSLTALGGTAASGAPTPEAAQIIGDDLVSGHKAGYTFVISDCSKKTADNHDGFASALL